MTLQEFLERLIPGLTVTTETALEIADHERKKLFLAIVFAFIHFVILVVVHAAFQRTHPGWFSAYNSIWGSAWTILLILAGLMLGGVPVHGTLLGNAAGNTVANGITRVIVGFCTIESFVNVGFALVPIVNTPMAWAMFFSLACAIPSYFLYRYMGGLVIDWKKWAQVPLFNIALAVVTMLVEYVRVNHEDKVSTAAGWGSSLSDTFSTDGGLWLLVTFAVVVIVVYKKGGFHAKTH